MSMGSESETTATPASGGLFSGMSVGKAPEPAPRYGRPPSASLDLHQSLWVSLIPVAILVRVALTCWILVDQARRLKLPPPRLLLDQMICPPCLVAGLSSLPHPAAGLATSLAECRPRWHNLPVSR
jgi:hypothetical protein